VTVKTLVVTDSSACLSPLFADREDLRILPVTVQIAGDETPEGVRDDATVWAAMAEGRHVWARSPSSGDYLVAVEESGADAVLIVTPAAEFAVMAEHARQAAALAGAPVVVVDSRTTASAQGLVVTSTLEAVADGAPITRVVQRAREASERARLLAIMGGVHWLERTGNVPDAVLQAVREDAGRPLFEVRDGCVVPVESPIGDPLQALAEAVRQVDDPPDAASAVYFHSGAADDAARLQQLLRLPGDVVEFSLALALHTGPGVVGLAWLHEPEPLDRPLRLAARKYAPGSTARAATPRRSQAGTTTSNRSLSTAFTTARATRSA
jgi:DegV family protein with EDD domain